MKKICFELITLDFHDENDKQRILSSVLIHTTKLAECSDYHRDIIFPFWKMTMACLMGRDLIKFNS